MTRSGQAESWKRLGVRGLKFYAVGGIGIAVQLVCLAIFRGALHLNYLLATALAVECAVVHNYVWHHHWTWSDRPTGAARQWLSRLLRFNLTTGVISIAGNLLLMRLLVGSLRLQYMLANLLTIALCSLANFWASDKVVFEPGFAPQGFESKSSDATGAHPRGRPLSQIQTAELNSHHPVR